MASADSRPPVLASRAPAKVNLTLDVIGRRVDGYHELVSIVVFAGVSDLLTLDPSRPLSLDVRGPTAGQAGPDADNLVLRAAGHLAALAPGLRTGGFQLLKRLPVAAGLGGGSSDAAAALRLLGQLNNWSPEDPRLLEAARLTGSDVPVCLDPRARIMAGRGETVGPALAFAPLFAVLVNPGVAVPTPAVFARLGLSPGERHSGGGHERLAPGTLSPHPHEVRSLALTGGNDLEAPAKALAPEIGVALDALRATPGARVARMSGSGATCFALYADCHAAAKAARLLRRAQPDWWIRPTLLR